jgi:LysR family nitrogen assimilation transcriptional regulator
MELRQLKYFVRIVELGSLSGASRDLYIAQPALSSQIANLEDELGARLLSRSVRGVVPTAAGQTLYLHAQAVLRQVARLSYEVCKESTRPGGPVSIGLPTSAANVLAGPLIAATQQRFPDIQLQIVESLSGHLEELVANGRIEMSLLFDATLTEDERALSSKKSRAAGFRKTPLLDEELFLLTATRQSTQGAATINIQDASQLRFVLPARTNSTRKLIDHAFASAGLTLDVMTELDSLSTIQSIVASGLGATILSLSSIVGSRDPAILNARSIVDVRLRRRLSLCTSDIVALGSSAECVIALVPELIRELIAQERWPGAQFIEELDLTPSRMDIPLT